MAFCSSEGSGSARRSTKKVAPFSLVELLVVISILAILMSLLSPSLKSLYRKSTLLSCSKNLKEMGLVFSIYAEDSNDFYPDRSFSSTDSNHDSYYEGRVYEATTYFTRIRKDDGQKSGMNHRKLLSSYFGSAESMKTAYVCPMVEDEISNSWGEGVRPLWNYKNDKGFPYNTENTYSNMSNNYKKSYYGTYKLFFSVKYDKGDTNSLIEEAIKIPMQRIGDLWRNGVYRLGTENLPIDTGDCNVLAMDNIGTNAKNWGSNHPDKNRLSSWNKDERKFWWEVFVGYTNKIYFETDANYLIEDLSVYVEPDFNLFAVRDRYNQQGSLWGPNNRKIPKQFWFKY